MPDEILDAAAYLAADGFEQHLLDEIGEASARYERLYLAPGPAKRAFWTQNIWRSPQMISISSISDAAKKLKAIQRNWAPYAFRNFRRMELIQDNLPFVTRKPRVFPFDLPESPMGSWTLLDENTILASPDCSSPFPNGEIDFVEDKFGPPSRAYLKLWEALTRARAHPAPGERCIDAGATPGGWTWALQGLGARVLSIDRAPLEPRIAALPNVEFLKHSAFTLKPEDIGRADWVFSDVIAYPEKLWEWIEAWLASGLCSRFVVTVKMQGDEVSRAVESFASVPGSSLVHLYNNKHELTWIKL
jgi:23S rRNA (cytidine2498-2'-O)-methyltransferase